MSSCILMAQLLGGPSPGASSAASDTLHALERARNRMKLALEAHGGQIEGQPGDDVLARFPSVDAAALAACEMIERVYQLPPVCGGRFGVRAAIELGHDDKARHEVSKLATVARPAESLLSAAAAPLLTPPTRQFAKAGPVQDATLSTGLIALTRHAALAGTAGHERRPPRLRLRVRHQGRTLYVDDQHPSLMLGREPDNDLVLDDPRASRRHARIDFRNNRFALVDHSSNGSWVEPASGTAVFIKGEEAELPLHGRIGLGFPAGEGEASVVDFEIH